MNKIVVIPICLALFLLVACSPAASTALPPYEADLAEGGFSAEAPAAEPRAIQNDSSRDLMSVENTERIVIKNASLEIIVNSPDESLKSISQMAEQMGGFVVSANLYNTRLSDGQEVPRGSITIRVPAEKLDQAIEEIEAESDRLPLTKNITSQDVTSDYTDLQSRLKNLEAAESQLMEIMGSANKTEDVLDVFNELTRVREQIEVIKGQIKYYDESARLSAITVELIPNEVVQPISIGGWQPVGVIKDAVQALISALQGLVTVVIWLGILILPILAIITLPLYFIIRAAINWRKRRQVKQVGGTSPESDQKD